MQSECLPTYDKAAIPSMSELFFQALCLKMPGSSPSNVVLIE